jgi:hypothetical protein
MGLKHIFNWDSEPEEEEEEQEPFFNADAVRDDKLTETPEQENADN